MYPSYYIRPSRRPLVIASAAFALLSSVVIAAAAPPTTPVVPVIDHYFGTTVTDNYRWLEDLSSQQSVDWFKAQSSYTNNALASIPNRDKLLTQIKPLDASTTTYSDVARVGTRIFYEKMSPLDETPKLFVRDGLRGAERLLIDPGKYAKADVHDEIDYFAPSLDGRYVAIGISAGGSENSTLFVVNADTSALLPDQIDRARFGSPAWLPSSKSFYYTRLPLLAAGSSPELAEEKSQVFLHVLGCNPESDQAVFGFGLSGRTNSSIEPNAISAITTSPISPYAVGVVEHGVQNELTLFAARITKVTGPLTPWVKVADVSNDVTAYDVRGSTIYLLTHHGAPRYKVVSMSLAVPDFSTAKPVITTSKRVIQGIAVAKDGLYATYLDGGIGELSKIDYESGANKPVPLPYEGTIAESSFDPRIPGAWLLLTGWTESALWYRYNPVTDELSDTGLKKKASADFSGIVAEEVMVPAADGTLIPLSIVYPKKYKLDGTHPTICEAYGAYGISMTPGFNPTLLAWFSHNGVYAVAHVRGGGEFGEDWHHGGMLMTKPNSWNDLIACSEYLIKHHYTSPQHLAIEGGSAGGITVGRALTTRPDLFGAVLDDVGASDALRQQFSSNGPANIPEFGDATTHAGFKALYAMDAYQHVRPGVKYPAVLLTTGINDPRVAPWEPAKMAAKLQACTVSGKPVLLRVDYDAGHGIGSDRSQSETLLADEWSFALWQLGSPKFQPVTVQP